jgi:hypothetical protein
VDTTKALPASPQTFGLPAYTQHTPTAFAQSAPVAAAAKAHARAREWAFRSHKTRGQPALFALKDSQFEPPLWTKNQAVNLLTAAANNNNNNNKTTGLGGGTTRTRSI